ncbi:MAG: DUF5789 family protein [Halobacteriales archaeon]
MAEDEDDETEPAVELGAEATVAGAPLARVAARQTWPKEASEIVERDGDVEIRTADGPVALAEVLDAVDDTYFASERHFTEAVREHLPVGPVPTED